MASQHPTEEQENVILSEAEKLLVHARAGAGKSSCLRMYAEARPLEKILLLAFSKAVQVEAEAKMPRSTRCLTTHGLSWHIAVELFGSNEKAKAKVGNTFPSQVAKRLRTNNLLATAALATIDQWCASTDHVIDEQHIPDAYADRVKERGQVVDAANLVWNLMLSKDEPDIKLPHDGYLKLFSMTVKKTTKYGTLLVDEFQDLNPSSLEILRAQTCKVVGVGDPYQQVFQFRGSVNGMRVFEADEHLHLTRSFRFGQGIADVANLLLQRLRRETRPTLGAPGAPATRFRVDKKKPFAVIARTNGALIERAVELFTDPRAFVFVGGVEKYRLSLVEDAFRLWRREHGNIRDPYLRSFSSLDELEALAKETRDAELSFLVKVVADYGTEVPSVIDAIRAKARDAEARGAKTDDVITFSTVHKSKGLEFDQVVIADDLAPLMDKTGAPIKPEGMRDEDLHLHYVAITRAKKALQVGAQLSEWLRHPMQRNDAPRELVQQSQLKL